MFKLFLKDGSHSAKQTIVNGKFYELFGIFCPCLFEQHLAVAVDGVFCKVHHRRYFFSGLSLAQQLNQVPVTVAERQLPPACMKFSPTNSFI